MLQANNKLMEVGVDLLSYCKRIIGDGSTIRFWHDRWRGGPLRDRFGRVYLLDRDRDCMVVDRVSGVDWRAWCRRQPRGGVEEEQFRELMEELARVSLSTSKDGWEWELNGGNGFTVASVRQLIDVNILDVDSVPTRWNVMVPSKVNIFA